MELSSQGMDFSCDTFAGAKGSFFTRIRQCEINHFLRAIALIVHSEEIAEFFLSLRFYVKSTLVNLQPQNLIFQQIERL